ncbi:peptidylprolyl isomerase [Shimia ponticola]|uniref:peptidylprolyl isomerase n=1 Tax=Shimia ponticola TaxID=2582893 RepID=UPI0011BF0DD9|nr:peptidylprolyl isomerase [Shimia ponticola]
MKPVLLFILTLLLVPVSAVAQSRFDPVITVNGAAITPHEIDQRARFLQFVRSPENAREQLVEDKLKMQAARQAGINLNQGGLDRGIEEFAGRANITGDELVQALRSQGIERETLEDFVRVNLTWREVIRAQYGPRASITESEIDRALAQSGGRGGVEVLLNEIILPARPIRGEAARSARQAERLSQLTSISAFQAQARQLSVSQTRGRSGRLDWLNLSRLPAPLRGTILSLRPGEVTDPISIPNAIVLFQLRDIRETTAPPPEVAAIDYAALYLPGGRSDQALAQANRIKDRVDTCDDLYGVARKWPREQLERGSKSPSDIPSDVAMELAKLDPGEVSTSLTRSNGETLVFLMLCSRTTALTADASRADVREQLRQRRLEGYADGFLAQLRSEAVITGQ